ncbi:GH32 C-terminal domain-containing protein, partial [Paenibacillus sepulcri]|nr:GH32 C-terminal domain-containing protein [Paenibacillus sepulcri]
PVPELSALRGDHSVFHELAVHAEPYDTGIHSRAYEAYAELDLADVTDPVVISVLRSSGGEEETRIVIDPSAMSIMIDRSRSSLFPGTHKSCITGKLPELENGRLDVKLFVDHSIIEVFAGDEACLSSRIYPSLADSDGLTVSASSGLTVPRFEVWQMKPAILI